MVRGTGNDFPRLKIRVRDELVAFGSPEDLTVDENGVVGAGKHLNPYEVHKLVEERGDEVVFFDGRNAFEAKIGKFKDAVIPNTSTTRDFVSEIESGKYDHLKDKPVVTYCTGGIRCEILSSVMKKMASMRFTKSKVESPVTEINMEMMDYGKARSIHLTQEWR